MSGRAKQREFELELRLRRDDYSNYHVEASFKDGDIVGEPRIGDVDFDFAALGRSALQEEEYGGLLRDAIFQDSEVKGLFLQARRKAEGDGFLRLRLFVDPTAPELHSLRWELLRDPEDGSFLSMDQTIVFSRFLSSLDWRRAPLRPHGEFKALLAISNPRNLPEKFRVDVKEEAVRAFKKLGRLKCRILADPGQATFQNINRELRKGCDIFFLICHGQFRDREPWLILEDDKGEMAPRKGEELALAIRDLRGQPRLVALASCESAGEGREQLSLGGEAPQLASHVLASLGPRLARVGVPAVIAMQGPVSVPTSTRFFETLFEELQLDGRVDRAAAAARTSVGDAHDWWVPALFTRLSSGRIWYRRGFGDEDQLKIWKPLLHNIAQKKCTPVLGPALTEYLVGSRGEIAQSWAREHHFPMHPHDQENLPQVAQYLARNFQHTSFPRNELVKLVRHRLFQQHGKLMLERLTQRLQDPEERREILERCGGLWKKKARRDLLDQNPDLAREEVDRRIEKMTDEMPIEELAAKLIGGLSLDEQFTLVGDERIKNDPTEPHRVLADLDLPLYITTNFANLMADALERRGKTPILGVYPWREKGDDRHSDIQWPELDLNSPPDGDNRSLVYHLFGRLAQPETVVLTEDDYFDYLINLDRHKNRLHWYVKQRVASTGLLFLGFKLDQWSFRVLFRSIISQEGAVKDLPHLAVQIDPEDGRVLEPELARQYLKKYFGKNLSIYWGSTQDFIDELKQQWEAYQSEEMLSA